MRNLRNVMRGGRMLAISTLVVMAGFGAAQRAAARRRASFDHQSRAGSSRDRAQPADSDPGDQQQDLPVADQVRRRVQPGAGAGRILGGFGRRQDLHLQPAPGRDMARRRAVQRRRRRVHRAGDHGHPPAVAPRLRARREHHGARRPYRHVPAQQPYAAFMSAFDISSGADLSQAPLRGDRLQEERVQQQAGGHRAVQVRRMESAARTSSWCATRTTGRRTARSSRRSTSTSCPIRRRGRCSSSKARCTSRAGATSRAPTSRAWRRWTISR